jgi:hypothetical protein
MGVECGKESGIGKKWVFFRGDGNILRLVIVVKD